MFSELHAAILEDLDADEPRLVLADALQRHGDPRGELIVIQCELARLGCDRTRVALWNAPAPTQSNDTTRRADWIGDALATGSADTIAKLRQREKALLARHERTWVSTPLTSYRFGRGFIDHVRLGPRERLEDAYRVHLRSIEIAAEPGEILESSLLAQCRQLRVTLTNPSETATLIDRLGGIGEPGAVIAGRHGELGQLRELALDGLRDAPSSTPIDAIGNAFDRLLAAPRFARLEAIDLYNQGFDTPERIVQILQAARLRELRLGLNQSSYPGGLTTQRPVYELLAATPAASSIEVLDLVNSGIDEALAPLAGSPHLQGLHALRIVTGPANRAYNEGARAIGNALPKLRVLDVRFSPFSRFLKDLLGGRGLGGLTHLGLRSCSLDDSSAKILAKTPRLQQLRVIDLRDNRITDAGAAALAAAGPGQLERLELGGNALTVKGRDLLNARFPEAHIEIGRPRK